VPIALAYTITEPTQFKCQTCEATYKVVRAEALPEYDRQLTV